MYSVSQRSAALRGLEEERAARPGDERLPWAMGVAYAAWAAATRR